MTLDVSLSGSGAFVSTTQAQNRVGFLAEDWVVTGFAGQDISPTESVYQLENAKIYIRPGF